MNQLIFNLQSSVFNCLCFVTILTTLSCNISSPERIWVAKHPFIANKAKKISLEARELSNQMKRDSVLDGDADGGRIDAFRHAYWMARLSQSFCWKKAISLGQAHEKGNHNQFKKGRTDEESVLPDSVSSAMDLYNNQIGASIGCLNRSISNDSLKNVIYKMIKSGKLVIIRKNENGIPLDCAGNIIDKELFKNLWNIPKCLIPSGF